MTFKNKTTKATTTKKYRCTVLAEKTEEEEPAEVVEETLQIASVKQNTTTEFTVTMSTALESVSSSNFTMVRDDDYQNITIKSATLNSSDPTQVTLVVYTSLTDAKTYTVTYTADDEAGTQSSAQITASDGAIASVAVTPLEITVNKATEITFQTLDANGVILSDANYGGKASALEVAFASTDGGYFDYAQYLTLYNVGDTATFTVTYHTYTYDSTGTEATFTGEFTVTAVEDTTTIASYNYTIINKDETIDWSTVTIDHTIAAGDTDMVAYFQILDSNGDEVTDSLGYTVQSSNTDIVVISGTASSSVGITVAPVSTGTAYLILYDSSMNAVYTLPITVKSKRVLTSVTLSSYSVYISDTVADEALGHETVNITALDQYGDAYDLSDDGAVSISASTENASVKFDNNTSLIVYGSSYGAKNGSYEKSAWTIKFTGTNTITKTLYVTNVKAENTQDEYKTSKLVFYNADTNEIVSSQDVCVTEDIGKITLEAKIVNVKDNAIFDDYRGDNITSAKLLLSGSEKYNSTEGEDVLSVDDNGVVTLNLNSVDDGSVVTKNLGAGTYTLKVYYDDNGNATLLKSSTLKLSDSQYSLSASVLKTSTDAVNLTDVLANGDYVAYYYNGTQVEDVTIELNVYAISGSVAYVTSVNVTYLVPDTSYYITEEGVSINKPFTSSSDWSN